MSQSLFPLPDDIPDVVSSQLGELQIRQGRPLLIADADEVLVAFVPHLKRFIRELGFEMRLVTYQLEGTMFPIGSDTPLPFDACIDLINQFFDAETEHQAAVEGASAALQSVAEFAQIVVLTNAPQSARSARIRNLSGLGMDFPVIANRGGKGRVVRWLASSAAAPTAFIDDSVTQIESVQRHAPDVFRVHFAEADFIRRIFPSCAAADIQAHNWGDAVDAIRQRLLSSTA